MFLNTKPWTPCLGTEVGALVVQKAVDVHTQSGVQGGMGYVTQKEPYLVRKVS